MPGLEKISGEASKNEQNPKPIKEMGELNDLVNELIGDGDLEEELVFEGKQGEVIDKEPVKEAAIAQFRGDARQVFESIVRTRGIVEEEGKKALHDELKKMLANVDSTFDMNEDTESMLAKISKKLEKKADDIEMESAMNADSNA